MGPGIGPRLGPPVVVAVVVGRRRRHVRRLPPPGPPGQRAARRRRAPRWRRLRRPCPTRPAREPCARSGRAFNDMAGRLEASDEARRRFLADVTHELRTPLTVLQGEVEAQLDGIHPRDDAHLTSCSTRPARSTGSSRTCARSRWATPASSRCTARRSRSERSSTMRSPRSPPPPRGAGSALTTVGTDAARPRARRRPGAPRSGRDQPAHQRRAPHPARRHGDGDRRRRRASDHGRRWPTPGPASKATRSGSSTASPGRPTPVAAGSD